VQEEGVDYRQRQKRAALKIGIEGVGFSSDNHVYQTPRFRDKRWQK
jgi:acylphosphatase